MTQPFDHTRNPHSGRIPDASDPCWREPPSRADSPAPPPRRPSPFPEGWAPGDPPIEYLDDSLGHEQEVAGERDSRVFDAATRVRFLDCLATVGEVRAAARRVGVSRETAYRARRRYPDFARLWDAALLHARGRAEAELATRALDGVKVPVFVRGELVATWRRHDARYLLALLARLDRRASECAEVVDAAARFDELLARHLGHVPPDGFSEAAGLWDDSPEEAGGRDDAAPTREEFAAWSGEQALRALAETEDEVDEEAEDRALADGIARGGALWDEWHEQARARVDAAIAGPPPAEAPAEPPYEVKSWPPRTRRESVSHVSHLSPSTALGGGSSARAGPILPRASTHL